MKHSLSALLKIALAVGVSIAIFYGGYQLDNRAGDVDQTPDMGYLQLDMDAYAQKPLLYLAEGWSYYDGFYLGPEEIRLHSPDAYVYIGQYGGFEMGDPNRSPYGAATYRMVIITDGEQREYSLEIPEISTEWTLWINGTEMRGDGKVVSFQAVVTIEIIFAVSDDGGLYSGILSAPAFGSPAAVGQRLTLSLMLHVAAGAFALVIAAFCLSLGRGRLLRAHLLLFGLTVFVACLMFMPTLHHLGLQGQWIQVMNRFFYYGVLFFLILLQGSRLTLQPEAYWPAVFFGACIWISSLIQPLITVTEAGSLYLYSDILASYKWMMALWLLGTGIWAARQRQSGSVYQLAFGTIFAAALVMDRLFPYSRAAVTGSSVEIAAFLLSLLTLWSLLRENAALMRQNARLSAEQELLELRMSYARKQEDYVAKTRATLHETTNRLTLLLSYCQAGQLAEMEAYLKELLDVGGLVHMRYSDSGLVSAILSIQFEKAEREEIYVEHEITGPIDALAIADEDLCGVLMNLLDNAIEACCRIPAPADRWIFLKMEATEDALHIVCANGRVQGGTPTEQYRTRGEESHGHGLGIMRKIAARYGGALQLHRSPDRFEADITLTVN